MGSNPGQRDRVSVLENCQLDTEVGGNGGFDVGGKGGQRRVERVVEAVAVEADAVAGWMEVRLRKCGPRPLNYLPGSGPEIPNREGSRAVRMRIVGYAASDLILRCWRREA